MPAGSTTGLPTGGGGTLKRNMVISLRPWLPIATYGLWLHGPNITETSGAWSLARETPSHVNYLFKNRSLPPPVLLRGRRSAAAGLDASPAGHCDVAPHGCGPGLSCLNFTEWYELPPPSPVTRLEMRHRQGSVKYKPWFLMQIREYMKEMVSSTGCVCVCVKSTEDVSTTKGVGRYLKHIQ